MSTAIIIGVKMQCANFEADEKNLSRLVTQSVLLNHFLDAKRSHAVQSHVPTRQCIQKTAARFSRYLNLKEILKKSDLKKTKKQHRLKYTALYQASATYNDVLMGFLQSTGTFLQSINSL